MAAKDRPPKCADCGGPHARWVPVGYEHLWLCVDCEYARRFGAAGKTAVLPPWERQPAPLQRERLF